MAEVLSRAGLPAAPVRSAAQAGGFTRRVTSFHSCSFVFIRGLQGTLARNGGSRFISLSRFGPRSGLPPSRRSGALARREGGKSALRTASGCAAMSLVMAPNSMFHLAA